MKKKILVITSSRADFGILSNLIKIIDNDSSLNLQLIVTGSHLNKYKNSSLKEITEQKIKIKKIIKIDMKNNSQMDTIKICSELLIKFKKTYDKIKPHLILILGDRFEIFSAALSAYYSRIPIAHIHGGEVTEGAFDEAIRHSITKLSNFHFVTNNEYYKRVIQLGENPNNIFLVGSLGSENIRKNILISKKVLEKKFNFNFKKINVLFTFHPVTLQKDYGKKDFLQSLKILKKCKNFGILFTSPNSDVSNSFFKKEIKKFVINNKNAVYIENMGKNNYFSVLKIIDCMIGNSSSGIIESAAFSLPVINIGNRQKGRKMNKNIINLKSNFNANKFKSNLNQAISIQFKKNLKNIKDLNYKKNTSLNMLNIIKKINYTQIQPKKFYDIKF